MTLAICTACGAEKFGAFVPCKNCGAKPTTVAERAKSITLSDHKFHPAELRKFGQMLKAGVRIPYDPVSLAACASQILSHDYYWSNKDAGREEFPCMICGGRFSPDQEEGLCPVCCAATDQTIPFCPQCMAINDQGTRFCPRCGSAISRSHLTARSVAISLLQGVEQQTSSRPLAKAQLALYADELVKSWEEIKWLAIYATSTILRENSHQVGTCIYEDMTYLYGISLPFRGIERELARYWMVECADRLTEYDKIIRDFVEGAKHDKNDWVIALAEAAEKHCYPRIEEFTGIPDLVTDIANFFRMQRDLLGSTLARTAEH